MSPSLRFVLEQARLACGVLLLAASAFAQTSERRRDFRRR